MIWIAPFVLSPSRIFSSRFLVYGSWLSSVHFPCRLFWGKITILPQYANVFSKYHLTSYLSANFIHKCSGYSTVFFGGVLWAAWDRRRGVQGGVALGIIMCRPFRAACLFILPQGAAGLGFYVSALWAACPGIGVFSLK